MCRDGSCGNFDPGSLRFVMLAQRRQPRIPGVALPPAGIFVSVTGQPMLGEKKTDPKNLYEALDGYFFSRAAALNHLPTLKVPGEVGKGTLRRLRDEIEACGQLAELGGLEQANHDYERPMLDFLPGDDPTSAEVIAVWRRGQGLSFGRHPMAGMIFSTFGGIQTLERLRIELALTYDDERRLRDILVKDKRFSRLPAANPWHADMAHDATLDMIGLLPPAIRQRLNAAMDSAHA